jgi:hypothetical protein
MVDGLYGRHAKGILAKGITRIHVAIDAGEIAA